MANSITVHSKANTDYNGTWARPDIEAEMESLGIEVDDDTDWVEFLFDHAFIDDFDPAFESIIDAFVHNDRVVEVYAKLDNNDDIKISKK